MGTFAVIVDPVLSPASPQAAALAHVFVVTMWVCAVIFAVVVTLVGICLTRFRKKGETEPSQVTGNERLEASWTGASIGVLILLFVLTVKAMNVSDPPADRAPDLTVIGHQWWWEVKYPGGAVAANEIHIPTGSNVLIRVESADVIHDLWAPQLGRKMDMVPGHPNYLWLRADAPGTYLGSCAEYCGAEHAWMRIQVMAEAPGDFASWLGRQEATARPAESALEQKGLELFRSKTCANCHAVKGVNTTTGAGPDLTHLGERETIGTGVLTNSAESLRLWLKNPQAVKPGCLMPNFHLQPAEIDALTAYLEDRG